MNDSQHPPASSPATLPVKAGSEPAGDHYIAYLYRLAREKLL